MTSKFCVAVCGNISTTISTTPYTQLWHAQNQPKCGPLLNPCRCNNDKMIITLSLLYLLYLYSNILVTWLTIFKHAGARYLAVVLVLLSLWSSDVKWMTVEWLTDDWLCVWMHGVFILWNLLEDMAQLQPWPHSLAYSYGVKDICIGLNLCSKLCHGQMCHCIFMYCYISLFTMKKIWTQF